MKIACITDDGKTISQHFGRASHFQIVTVEDGQIAGHELREKMAHTHVPGGGGVPGRRGIDAGSHDKHVSMAQVIKDCEVLLCRGMGYGAYQSMQQVGITPVVTDEDDIDKAVLRYVAGDLPDHPEKLH